MKKQELLRLAELGARTRLTQIQTEITDIHRQFPSLKTAVVYATTEATAVVYATTEAKNDKPRTGRRKIGRAERKAISERMTRYWARRRRERS